MTFQEIDDELWEIIRKNLPRQKPHIGRPWRDPRSLFNGIYFVQTTGCAWNDVPGKYGTKSTVHRYHLELCKRGAYQAIFLNLPQSGYDLPKLDLVHCITDTKGIPAKKGKYRLLWLQKCKRE
ncbi:MAG: transposase [Methanomicrobiales archaeon]|nr:transposase [Methanomicrobiales archaeon]MDI6877647.1 transposase [Methanomicrobiales archaeon]